MADTTDTPKARAEISTAELSSQFAYRATKDAKHGRIFKVFDADDREIAECHEEGNAHLVARLMTYAASVLKIGAKLTCTHSEYKGMEEHGRCCPACGAFIQNFGD